MSFGGGGSSIKPQFTGLAIQTSSSSAVVQMVWGQCRGAGNIIWQNDFKAHEQKQGKGGGKTTGYTYSGSFIIAHGWGQMEGIGLVYKDKEITSLAALGFTFFAGATPQAPWGYLSVSHPTEALGYPGIAFSAVANYDLGGSNTISQHSFELKARRWNTAPWTGGGDADLALIVEDFLSNPSFGVGLDMAFVDDDSLYSTPAATTTGDNALQTYCRAMGWGYSPILATQEQAADILKRWATISNSTHISTGYALKFLPFCAEQVTGNGVTYLPDFPVRYRLADKDFEREENADPVKFDRANPADCKNQQTITIANRANQYNDLPVPWQDLALINQFGEKPESAIEAKEICDQAMATEIVALIGQRGAYIRNAFKARVGFRFVLLEAGDVVELDDPVLGVVSVMLDEVTENDSDQFELAGREWQESLTLAPTIPFAPVEGTNVNTGADPGPVNPPILIEPPALLAGGAEIWAAVSGGDGTTADPMWGGCNVWLSTDGTTYSQIGVIQQPARMGKLTAGLAAFGGVNPDAVHTLAVSLAMSGGALASASSPADAAAASTLCYVDGEYLAPEIATLTGLNAYDLTNLYRGLFGSVAGAHASGTAFARLDNSIFRYALPAAYIGMALSLKFQSFNIWGGGLEDLASCTAYSITPTGEGYGTGTDGKPAAPTGLAVAAGAGTAILSWNANSGNDNVTAYEVWRASATGASFGTASRIAAAVQGLTWTDTSGASGAGYTYFLKAVNVIGASPATAGVNFTLAGGTAPVAAGFQAATDSFVAGKQMVSFDLPFAWSLPIGLTDSQATIGDTETITATAPSADTDFDIQSPAGTSIGTLRVPSGSLTATFVKAAASAIPLGQPAFIVWPASLNGLAGRIYGSLKGTR